MVEFESEILFLPVQPLDFYNKTKNLSHSKQVFHVSRIKLEFLIYQLDSGLNKSFDSRNRVIDFDIYWPSEYYINRRLNVNDITEPNKTYTSNSMKVFILLAVVIGKSVDLHRHITLCCTVYWIFDILWNIYCMDICLFVCLFAWSFSSNSTIFQSFGDVTIVGEGLQILTYARH